MKLSIITINYNNSFGLKKTIRSVLNQKEYEFEFIIIDGGSKDESINIIKDNEKIINFWVSEKDDGIYDAMNKGIKQASGDYLMFLNSGDCLSAENIIDVCINNIDKHNNVDIFYGDIYGISEKDPTPWIHTHPSKLEILFWEENNINHQSALIKADLFGEFGLYPKEYKLAGDHWIFFKSYLAGKVFKHISYPLIIYDYGGISVSETGRLAYKKERTHMWNTYMPQYMHDLMSDFKQADNILKRKPFKVLINIYKTINTIKKLIKRR